MLENLLTAAKKLDPNSPDPKPALAHAANKLHEVAQQEGASETQDFDTVKAEILRLVDSVAGGIKGPAQDVRSVVNYYLNLAIGEQYDFAKDGVRQSFAYFLLAVVTEGFVGKDTGGTTVGNFKGEWRGGGFHSG
ncbi:MAG: hypothetical protein AB1704_35430 [Pseudomonadota bacterium]|jgi:hypothetical protein|uniref:hypothetical protein n=1 Tax=Burkholderiaceae TaxID=119060 RepID=UPI0010F92762|nr:hypothetical protein [Burkholderia sp. 4M9327F10]